jgi:hypothetical protein
MITILKVCQYVLLFVNLVMWLFLTNIGFGEKYLTIKTVGKKYDFTLFMSILNSIIIIILIKLFGF